MKEIYASLGILKTGHFTGATGTGKSSVARLLAQLRVLETQKSSISTAKNEPVEITIDDLSSVKWKEVHNPKIGF